MRLPDGAAWSVGQSGGSILRTSSRPSSGGCDDPLCCDSPMSPAPPSVRPGRARPLPTSSPPPRAQLAHAVGRVGLVAALRQISRWRQTPPCSRAEAMPVRAGSSCWCRVRADAGLALGPPVALSASIDVSSSLPGGLPSERTKVEKFLPHRVG